MVNGTNNNQPKKKVTDPTLLGRLNARITDPGLLNRLNSAPADVTSVTNQVKSQPTSFTDLLASAGRPLLAGMNPAYAAKYFSNPQQATSDIGTLAEVGLPFLAAPLPPFLRTVAGGALQGTGTLVKEALNSAVGNRLYGQPAVPLKEQFKHAGISAGIGAAAQGVGELAGKALSPFAKQVDVPTQQLASQYGLELPASAISNAKAVPIIESIAGKGLFGQRLTDMVETAGTKLNQIADNSIARFGKSTNPVDVGNAIESGFKNYESVFRKTKDALYEQATLQPGVTVNPQETVKALKSVISDLENVVGQKPTVLRYLKSLEGGLDPTSGAVAKLRASGYNDATIQKILPKIQETSSTGIDATKLYATLKDLNKKINFNNPNPIVQGYEGRLRSIGKAMSDDLDNAIAQSSPDLAQKIDAANSYYKSGLEKLNSSFGKKINQFIEQGKTSELPDVLLNQRTPVEWIPKIYESVGPEAKKSLQASTLETIIKKARGSGDFLQPQGIARQIRSFGTDRLNAIFPEETVSTLSDLSGLSRSLGKAQKVSEGSQTAFIWRLATELVNVGVAPLRALKLLASDATVSKLISSPTGQKWLTTGFAPNAGLVAGQTARIGTIPVANTVNQ